MPELGEEPSALLVLGWLTLLNSDDFAREPLEFFEERRRLEAVRHQIPEFAKAATFWPTYADKHWTTVRKEVNRLFRRSHRPNFAQWILEYVKHWLEVSNETVVDLTDALHFNKVSSLDAAAALGLENFCREYWKKHSKMQTGVGYRSRLFSALAGPRVLVGDWNFKFESWDGHLPLSAIELGPPESRKSTILFWAASESSYEFKYRCEGDWVSLACLAFWDALLLSDVSIFDSVVASGASIYDDSFSRFLGHSLVMERGELTPGVFAKLIFCALDHTLTPDGDGPLLQQDSLRLTISMLMERIGVNFATAELGEVGTIEDDEDFEDVVRNAVRQCDAIALRRLALDPRFDSEMGEMEYGGTILHLAVASDAVEIVDFLIGEGSSLIEIDSQGRTPAMVVESPEMLRALISKYGASTRQVNNAGRNIWHFAAASNDVGLLKILCEVDPWKKENLIVQTDDGNTPTAEAFLFVETTADMERPPEAITPICAKLLLEQHYDERCLASSRPLPHLAAAWGDSELIDKLVDLGVAFDEDDDLGQCALHHLNLSASQGLIQRLFYLCKKAFVANDAGMTWAETMLQNTAYLSQCRWLNGLREYPSAHPSCRGKQLQQSVYNMLLTPAVLEWRDYRNRSTWERFCLVTQTLITSKDLDFLRQSYLTAAKCLINKGALKTHEEEGESGVYCFRSPKPISSPPSFPEKERDDMERVWYVQRTDLILLTLQHSDRQLSKRFFDSGLEATQLLGEAVLSAAIHLVTTLCANRVSPHLPLKGLKDRTPLELALVASLQAMEGMETDNLVPERRRQCLDAILRQSQPRDLQTRQEELFSILLLRDVELRQSPRNLARAQLAIAKTLFESGLSPVPNSSESPSFLASALASAPIEVVRLILERLVGLEADLTLGKGGKDVPRVAALRDLDVFQKVMSNLKHTFDWSTPTHNLITNRSILEAAAGHGCQHLAAILEQTPLRDDINTELSDGDRLVHKAAFHGKLGVLDILGENGADFLAVGRNNRTALHAAVIGLKPVETAEFLMFLCPTDAVDADGKTAIDLALKSGDEELVALLTDSRIVRRKFTEWHLGTEI